MKKLILLILTIYSTRLFSQTPTDTANVNGVWLYNIGSISQTQLNNLSQLPYKVQGGGVYINWKDLQPTPTTFNWNVIDNALTKLKNAHLYATLMIWVGPSSPLWIYNTVDSVKTNDSDSTFYLNRYPYYLDPQYKPLWFKMLDSVIIHCGNLPPSLKSTIKTVQSAEGTSGDLTWYKGTPTNVPTSTVGCSCSSYNSITSSIWVSNIIQPEWKRMDSLLTIYLPQAHHLVNAGSDKAVFDPAFQSNFIWSRANFPYMWYKANNMAHLYQMNDEPDSKTLFDTILNQPYNNQCYPKVRTRDEFDLTSNKSQYFSPNWHLYFTAANALYFGVDMWNIFASDISNSNNFEGLKFFSRYAGVKNAACTSGAFSILHDGLDADDSLRFSTAIYGHGDKTIASITGQQRCTNIANSLTAFGASQDNPIDAQGGSFKQVSASKINDVGWNIFTGNYERYLTQWAPNATSQGYWRQGDTLQPYGRFARGFDHSTGKDTLFFNINDTMFGAISPTVTVNITYLDKGTGTWALQYDGKNSMGQSVIKTAFNHTNTNTTNNIIPINNFRNQNYVWKTESITITDGLFANNCGHNTDLRIVNTDNTNEIFHMVEVLRGNLTTGINLHSTQLDKINVYPNPTKELVTFDFLNYNGGEFKELIIYNLLGAKVYVEQLNTLETQHIINIKNLAPGIYTFILTGNNTTIVNKLIKE
ncbi:MAG: T9SS type A sorting domain-containing protein [Bacteroidia bacterium]